jgi:predicted DNA-binding transcriptional regulator AlpA
MERAGQFPKRRQLSANSVGYLKSEVDQWINSRALVGRQS